MGLVQEFREFAMRGNVVDMAVGVVIGAAFGRIVASFTNDVLMPPVGLAVGGVDFSDLKVTLKAAAGPVKEVSLNYGAFATAVVDFTIMAFAVFMLVKGLNALKRKEPAAVLTPSEKTCAECLSAIPIKARRCSHCAEPQAVPS